MHERTAKRTRPPDILSGNETAAWSVNHLEPSGETNVKTGFPAGIYHSERTVIALFALPRKKSKRSSRLLNTSGISWGNPLSTILVPVA